MGLTYKDISSIISMIEKIDYDIVRLESGDFRLEMQKSATTNVSSSPSPTLQDPLDDPTLAQAVAPTETAPVDQVPATSADDIPQGCYAIRAPMLGVFYRKPSPSEPPFVEVGSTVQAEDTIGLIEVMKLFNSIAADQNGEVVEIRAQHGKLVEYDE